MRIVKVIKAACRHRHGGCSPCRPSVLGLGVLCSRAPRRRYASVAPRGPSRPRTLRKPISDDIKITDDGKLTEREFLEAAVGGLGEQEVDEDDLEEQKYAVADIVLPSYIIRDRTQPAI